MHVEEWCKRCNTCGSGKEPRTRTRRKIRQIDVVGPFPQSDALHYYVLIAIILPNGLKCIFFQTKSQSRRLQRTTELQIWSRARSPFLPGSQLWIRHRRKVLRVTWHQKNPDNSTSASRDINGILCELAWNYIAYRTYAVGKGLEIKELN